MYALLAIFDSVLALTGSGLDMVLASTAGESSNKFVKVIRDFVGPILLLGIGIAALSFLFQRQMTQFLQFLVLAIGIGVLFYVPGIIEVLAKMFGTAFGGTPA